MRMKNFMKRAAVFVFALSSIGVLAAAAEPARPRQKKELEKSQLIDSRAMMQDDFSGIESRPIIKAFMNWMNETSGDILIMPPSEGDSLFFDLAIKGDAPRNNFSVFDMDLIADASTDNPWQKGCRHAFYVIRVNSKDAIVKSLDGEDRQIMAFTFTGCTFKFIAVVADRMKSEDMLYTTMLHELGHMWGLPDNKEGSKSIMAGVYPGAPCITRRDLQEVYDRHGKPEAVPENGGCTP
jgi:hypothetical protein